jgi:hypothetical protein
LVNLEILVPSKKILAIYNDFFRIKWYKYILVDVYFYTQCTYNTYKILVNHLTKKSKVTYDLKYMSLRGMYLIFFSFQKHYGLWWFNYKLFNIGIQWGNVLYELSSKGWPYCDEYNIFNN